MRTRKANDFINARAVAGKYVVFLAWELKDLTDVKQFGLLGFAIERSDLKPDGSIPKKHCL